MYTQCPDCATAFRVTAEILKQAGGKVRCGGCGIAFNALAYLSESKPAAPPPPDDEALPELTPDTARETEETPPPRAISPEQSAALLKTLDELAGTDIRLEDTGVEWRVLSEDDEEDIEDEGDALQLPDDTGTPVDAELSGDTGSTALDEVLDDTPAEVDEFLAEAPNEVEAAEVFDARDSDVESPEIFDDASIHEQSEENDAAADRAEETQGDELRFDDNTGLPDDEDADDSVVAFEHPAEPEPEPEFIEPASHTETQVDMVFGEPDEWGELLDEVDVVPDDEQPIEAVADDEEPIELEAVADDEEPIEVEAIAEDEEPIEIRGEIIEPEIDGNDGAAASLSIEDELDALDDELSDEHEQFPESTGELESELARAQDLSDKILSALSRHGVEDVDELELDDEGGDDAGGDFELGGDFDEPESDAPDIPVPVILPETEEEQTINRMIDQDLLKLAGGGNEDDDASGAPETHIDVPGFPSMDAGVETIIMEGEFVRTALEQEALEAEAAQNPEPEEHSFIAAAKKTFRGRISRHDDADEDDEPTPKRNYRIAAGLGLLGVLLAGQLVHQSRAELATIPAVNTVIAPIYRMIGAPITPHWDVTGWKFEVTRETLSGGEPIAVAEVADDAAGSTAESDGEAIGDDLLPTGSTAGAAAARTPEILTIYSRLGNSADHPLPYPLITVSLTDRYEETIGSTVLEPSDYLPAQADASRLISPGNTFEAVIPIESPSGDATGYKLNVCYRQAGSTLRCAVADFK